ncbi:MAG: 4-alpha-glucanotransferase [Chlamydiota bacterium]
MNLFTNLLKGPTGKQWQLIGPSPHHGICLPLSSLHTENSCGIGEILDLIPLIDWVQSIEMDVIQLLPLNDSGTDCSPYNAISSCALNPIYLALSALPYLEEYPDLVAKLNDFKSFNTTPRVDYKTVLEKKMEWLFLYFEKTGTVITKDPAFHQFVADNPWLEPYALFKLLKNTLKWEPWQEWAQEFKTPDAKEYALLVQENWEGLCFYIALQHLLFEQLTTVKNYATEKKVNLMGDIPILISPDSADVWHDPSIFDLSMESGAPPDMYIKEGQNWGFPIYNWEEMEKRHYELWKRRLSCAERFFHIYRIDHVVGFFRIWAMPKGKSPRDGTFVPQDESLWQPQGEKLLKMMIKAAPSLLPIGEDLGITPDSTHETLIDLGICSTKVMRWERKWKEDYRFIPIEEYHPISMTTVSTHDSEPLSLWWKTSPKEAMAFAAFKKWEYTPILTQEQRQEILFDSHHSSSIFHVNPLQEYLAYFPELVSSNPEEERINIPGKILPTNWTYRFIPSIRDLQNNLLLKEFMRKIHV